MRNRDEPQWFDHRYRFKPSGWGPAGRNSAALAVTGACMYVRRELIERIGLLDERYAMAYEDVDWCLRAWQAGFGVVYFPAAQLIHHESVTRGTESGRARARLPAAVLGALVGASSTRASCDGATASAGTLAGRAAARSST